MLHQKKKRCLLASVVIWSERDSQAGVQFTSRNPPIAADSTSDHLAAKPLWPAGLSALPEEHLRSVPNLIVFGICVARFCESDMFKRG